MVCQSTSFAEAGSIRHHITKNNPKWHNKVTKSHTMLAQDSFLGSLLVLPVELWNGIAG